MAKFCIAEVQSAVKSRVKRGKLPLPALLGAPGGVPCVGFLAEKQILSLDTQLAHLSMHDAEGAYVHWSGQDILA